MSESIKSQILSPSRSAGESLASSGSEPQLFSNSSENPSLSSSSSSTSGGFEVDAPVRVSGIPSPSVSVSADGSSGNASGPAPQIPATESGPSQIPSPSVSGFRGSVPVSIVEL